MMGVNLWLTHAYWLEVTGKKCQQKSPNSQLYKFGRYADEAEWKEKKSKES